MRPIDADAMMKRLKAWDTNDAMDKALYNFALDRVLEAPTVEPEQELQRISQQAARVGVDVGTMAEAFRRVAEMSVPTKDTTFAGKAQLSGEDTTYNIEKLREYVGLLPYELTDIAYEAVDALASQPRWIPCSERLPKVGEDVLFSVSGVYAAEGCLRADGNWAQFRWDGIQHKNMVDAWMPLPQPYQGERREEP